MGRAPDRVEGVELTRLGKMNVNILSEKHFRYSHFGFADSTGMQVRGF